MLQAFIENENFSYNFNAKRPGRLPLCTEIIDAQFNHIASFDIDGKRGWREWFRVPYPDSTPE